MVKPLDKRKYKLSRGSQTTQARFVDTEVEANTEDNSNRIAKAIEVLERHNAFTLKTLLGLMYRNVRKRISSSRVYRACAYIYSVLFVYLLLSIMFIILGIGVEMPSRGLDISAFVKQEDGVELSENVYPLAVSQAEVTAPLNLLVYYIMNWEYRDEINVLNLDKLNPLNWFGDSDTVSTIDYRYSNLGYGSSLLDSQMSAFIVLNRLKGTDIPYEQDVKVLSVKYPKDYSGLWNVYPDDIIVSINGVVIKDALDLTLKRIEFGDTAVTMQLKRGDSDVFVVGKIPSIEAVRVIRFKDVEYYTPFNNFAELYSKNIEGSSAGISMTLGYYDTYMENVTRGRKVALSGIISPDGSITPIAGVNLKTAQAIREGVDILFFANDRSYPRKDGDDVEVNNLTVAKETVAKYDSNIKVIGVDNFEDIIEYLKKN